MKYKIPTISAILFLMVYSTCFGADKSKDSVLSSFNKIGRTPSVLTYSNTKEINNSGGHLQGIQLVEGKSAKYAVLTGSSGTWSYYSVVKLGAKNEVLSVNKLMDKPYKHAGGFQIFQNYMAVGIEDNSLKDKSMVCIFDLSDPEKPSVHPVSVIKRTGEPLRSTAGCVGITKYRDKMLVAVCDWDTKHVDLYSGKFAPQVKDSFDKVYSIDTESILKTGWIDNSWYSYQNINLFTFGNNELYMIGLGQNSNGEDVADLYSLTEAKSGDFKLVKLASKIFDCQNGVSFRAGAGVFLGADGEFSIISCGNNIESTSYFNLFEK